MPLVMSHISWVQTLVNANGKNRSNVFLFPKLLLSFTSTRPEACLDFRLKSGALVPTDRAIDFIIGFEFWVSDFQVRKAYMAGSARCQIAIRLRPPAGRILIPPPKAGGNGPRLCAEHQPQRHGGATRFQIIRRLLASALGGPSETAAL